jgi:type II secretory pathway pseudopilin PulG
MKKITGLLVLIILVVFCFGSLGAQNKQQALVNALRTVNHQIDVGTASRLIANLKGNVKTNLPTTANAAVLKGNRGGVFARSAFDKILSQPGVIGIRTYYAANDDGSSTLVLVGVDDQGQDMSTGAFMDNELPCPPFCPDEQ